MAPYEKKPHFWEWKSIAVTYFLTTMRVILHILVGIYRIMKFQGTCFLEWSLTSRDPVDVLFNLDESLGNPKLFPGSFHVGPFCRQGGVFKTNHG